MRDHSAHIEFADERERLEFDLHMAFDHGADWFTAQLFRLIAKADNQNRLRLSIGFPLEVEVFNAWHQNKLIYHEAPWRSDT